MAKFCVRYVMDILQIILYDISLFSIDILMLMIETHNFVNLDLYQNEHNFFDIFSIKQSTMLFYQIEP